MGIRVFELLMIEMVVVLMKKIYLCACLFDKLSAFCVVDMSI